MRRLLGAVWGGGVLWLDDGVWVFGLAGTARAK